MMRLESFGSSAKMTMGLAILDGKSAQKHPKTAVEISRIVACPVWPRNHCSSLPILDRQEKAQQEAAAKEPEGSGVHGGIQGYPIYPNLFQFLSGKTSKNDWIFLRVPYWTNPCECPCVTVVSKTSKVQVGTARCHQVDGGSIHIHVHIDMPCSYTLFIYAQDSHDYIHCACVTGCNWYEPP